MQEHPQAGSQAGVPQRAQTRVQERAQAGAKTGVPQRPQTGNATHSAFEN